MEFIEIIRKFPTIYNRSLKSFKDRNKKPNCWKAISEKVGQPVDKVKRRYESIRTQFGKNLKSRKGKSGSGSGDVPIDPKYEHLRWLKNFIVSRASSGNIKSIPSNTSIPAIKSVETVSEDVFDSDDETINQPPPTQLSDKEDGDNDGNDLDMFVSSRDTADSPISEMSSKEKSIKPWVKKESSKRELEKTDAQLNRAMNNLSESITLHKKSAPKEKKMDEDELHVLSLANRLRSLDRRQKAIARNTVEKVFLDIELGFYNAPQQAQLGNYQMGPLPNTDNQNMYWSNQSLNSSNTPFNTQTH